MYGLKSQFIFLGSTLIKQSYRTVQLLHLLTAAKWHPTFATGVAECLGSFTRH